MAPLKPDQRYLALPIALALSLAMLTLSLFVPAEYSTEILLSLLFWLGRQSHTVVHSASLNISAMIAVTGHTIFKNGPEYVDQPHLVHIPPKPEVSP